MSSVLSKSLVCVESEAFGEARSINFCPKTTPSAPLSFAWVKYGPTPKSHRVRA